MSRSQLRLWIWRAFESWEWPPPAVRNWANTYVQILTYLN